MKCFELYRNNVFARYFTFSFDIDSAIGPMHFVDAGGVANVSEAYTAPIFGDEVNRLYDTPSTADEVK
jgi:hypothetical protein